jgi:hypothetical protein
LPIQRPEKICVACGRRIQWRKKWERDWDQVRYCGDACRRAKHSDIGDRLEKVILTLLAKRKPGDTICPSEAARIVAGTTEWQPLMEPARSAARRLVAAGKIVITQKSRVVDPSTARGPIRLKIAPK